MSGSPVAGKRKVQSRTKVKTGCTTCRIRKVKCDEKKPFCQKCVDTGRNCDGYESTFRNLTSQCINNTRTGSLKSGVDVQPVRPTLANITPEDIDLLSRYFSTKTVYEIRLGCDEEARQALQASLTDPSIRHAISSLKALREDFEASGNAPASLLQQSATHDYGLQQYCMALRVLASDLSSSGSDGLKSALHCCQIFISIEQVRGNYAIMAQHIIQGLRIMYENGARPVLDTTNNLVPARQDQLPLLDVFIIKLFAAPCKFADSPAAARLGDTPVSVSSISLHEPVESRGLRMIAPDMRVELTRIAASTLEFLDKVLHVNSSDNALRLLSVRASLLVSLDLWLTNLEHGYAKARSPRLEPTSVSFMRLFYQILRIILLRVLQPTSNLVTELQAESNQLQKEASNVDQRVKAYHEARY